MVTRKVISNVGVTVEIAGFGPGDLDESCVNPEQNPQGFIWNCSVLVELGRASSKACGKIEKKKKTASLPGSPSGKRCHGPHKPSFLRLGDCDITDDNTQTMKDRCTSAWRKVATIHEDSQEPSHVASEPWQSTVSCFLVKSSPRDRL